MLDATPIADTSEILSPGLVIFRDLVEQNLAEMIRIAGSPARLRPHCKTHKMREIDRAATGPRHPQAQVRDDRRGRDAGRGGREGHLPGVQPGRAEHPPRRAVRRRSIPTCKFAVTADHPRPIAALGEALGCGRQVGRGAARHRLRPAPHGHSRRAPRPASSIEQIADTKGLRPGGLHLYDGHNHQNGRRRAAGRGRWRAGSRRLRFATSWWRRDCPCRGSSPAARRRFRSSPRSTIRRSSSAPARSSSTTGATATTFPDLEFTPAALLLTRVISRPTADRVTLDLGYKAVASAMPLANRLLFPDLPDAKAVLQNEEHLVLETPAAARYSPRKPTG